MIVCTIFQPVSLIQTRFQVTAKAAVKAAQGSASSLPYNYKGFMDALRTIVREEGVRALYQGLSPALLGNAASWGLYFAFYTEAKAQWLEHKVATRTLEADRYGNLELGAKEHILCATAAGWLTSLCTNPIWVLKTRMQVQSYGSEGRYTSMADGARRIWQKEGVAGLYRGLVPSLFGVSHGVVQFVIYEDLKKWRRASTGLQQIGGPDAVIAGAVSKVVAGVTTYPYHVVKSRIQMRAPPGKPHPYTGVLDVISKTWRREGVQGFYRGCGIAVVRTTPASALTFGLYEYILGLLHR